MKRFFEFFASRHLFALMITFMIILLGLTSLPNINRDTFPNVSLDKILISTRYEGSSPEDIELKITNKIEEKLKSIDGIKQFLSYSVENISFIDISLDSNLKKPDDVIDKIKSDIDNINDFPIDLENDPTITNIKSATIPILEIGIVSDTLTYSQLRHVAKKFKKDLDSLNGISQINSHGYRARELSISADPFLLNKYQISLLQVISTISNRNLRSSMGTIKQNDLNSTIINDSRLFDLSSIKNAIIRSNFDGKTVKISDIAIVEESFEKEIVLTRSLGKKGISFTIIKSETADIIALTNKIDQLINSYASHYSNIQFVKAKDFSMYLKNRLKVMISNGIIGLILAVLVLTFFLNIKMAFWVSLGIPVSVMGVFFAMPFFDMTINIISLLAIIIVIGIIVDDGIIIGESIAKHREHGVAPLQASINGVHDVFKPVFTTILTTIVAFSPMFFMSGIMGKFVFQIPLVVTIALIISLIEVLIALPGHLAAGKTNTQIQPIKQDKRLKLMIFLRSIYKHILFRSLQHKYKLVLCFLLVFFGVIIFAYRTMNFVLTPESSSVSFYIKTETPIGTPLDKTATLMVPIEAELLKLPKNELLSITTRIGMTGESFLITEQENLGIIFVDLIPFSGRHRTAREIMTSIKEKTKNLPGFTKLSYEIESGGPPVGKAIDLQIISDNNEIRTKLASAIYNFTKGINGVQSIERNDKKQAPQFNIIFDYNKISQLGLSISSIHQTIRSAFSGAIASTIRKGDEKINFMIKLSNKHTSSLSTLNSLTIPNNMGRLISLKSIATIKQIEGEPNYTHFNGARSITISGDIDSRIITSSKVKQLISKKFNQDNYPNVKFYFSGESEETNQSIQDLIKSFTLAIVGIFFILILLFNSLLQPLIVISTIPFGLIGVIIAFALHGEDLGFISMVGAIGLTGVVVNDSLVLVNHLNTKIKSAKKVTPLINTITEGSVDRFRPILITSLTTVAGLLPLAYGLGGSDPFIAPMALAIGYGLLFSTPLTLFLLPALFLILNDITSFPSKKLPFFLKKQT